MAITDIDKGKIRTAVKCYLFFNKKATARQLHDFLLEIDLKLRMDITANELASELKYCCKNNNFLNLDCKKKYNTTIYYLKKED